MADLTASFTDTLEIEDSIEAERSLGYIPEFDILYIGSVIQIEAVVT